MKILGMGNEVVENKVVAQMEWRRQKEKTELAYWKDVVTSKRNEVVAPITS